MGCGNGRDSFYFVENYASHVIGVDQSNVRIQVVISDNTNNIDNLEDVHRNNIEFDVLDFVDLNSCVNKG